MKITAIKPFPVWVGHRNQLLVKVETDEGIFGWGESGLSGREKAVVGAVEHFAEFLRRQGPDADRRASGRSSTAASTSRAAACCWRRSRPSTSRSTTSRARRSGVPVYELLGGKQRDVDPHLRLDRLDHRARRRDDRAGAKLLDGAGWSVHPLLPRRRDNGGIFEPRECDRARPPKCLRPRARGARRRGRARHRLSPPPVRRRDRQLLPEDAPGHARLPRGADPRRDARSLRALRTPHRRALRHRRGVRLASGSSCPTSSAASTSSTGSTSATSAASPRR